MDKVLEELLKLSLETNKSRYDLIWEYCRTIQGYYVSQANVRNEDRVIDDVSGFVLGKMWETYKK